MENLLIRNQEAQKLIDTINGKINLLRKGGIDTTHFEKENKELNIANDALRAKIIQGNVQNENNIDLTEENSALKAKITAAKEELIQLEIVNGKKQISVPEVKKVEIKVAEKPIKEDKPPKDKESIKEVKSIKEDKQKAQKAVKKEGDTEIVDATKLDMRVGKILEVTRHADADSLYVEKVDIGEGKTRQIISGLVKHCAEEDLKGRLCVFLLNLKPAKMRGVMSEGMVMCASTMEKVEPLNVPEGAQPGDRVVVDGYIGEPDEVLNAKKKHFELIKPDLRVNAKGEATYKGALWRVGGKAVTASSLTDVQIA